MILVEDTITKVKISKTDVTGDEELPGATLQILDAEGNVVKTWVSGTEPYYVEGLKTGVDYKLVETIAPDGYTITSETVFSINAETGKVTSTGTVSKDDKGVEILVVNDSKTHITVSKRVQRCRSWTRKATS